MAMNVKPVPTLDDEVNEIRLGTAEIVNQDILPNETETLGLDVRQCQRAEQGEGRGAGAEA